MRTIHLAARFAAGLVLAAALGSTAALGDTRVVRSDATLDANMRELWDAQATWTRLYLVSALGNLPDSGFARARLLRCPDGIGRAIEVYYGRPAGDSVALALRRHLLTLVVFVGATKRGDVNALNEARQGWRADAESAAAAFGRVNPAWAVPSFRELLDLYLQLTDRQVTQRARGEYALDTASFDELHEVARRVAHVIARDILRQFEAGTPPGKR